MKVQSKDRHLRLPIHLSSTPKPRLPNRDGPRHLHLLNFLHPLRPQHLQPNGTCPVCQHHALPHIPSANAPCHLAMEGLR